MAVINLQHGQRISGHAAAGESPPEIAIYDGIGPGNGSLLCSIEYFHWADVAVRGDVTELRFEDRVSVSIDGGVVEYIPGEPEELSP